MEWRQRQQLPTQFRSELYCGSQATRTEHVQACVISLLKATLSVPEYSNLGWDKTHSSTIYFFLIVLGCVSSHWLLYSGTEGVIAYIARGPRVATHFLNLALSLIYFSLLFIHRIT